MDVKVSYASTTGAQGSDSFYCDRVREVQEYTNWYEDLCFAAYDTFMSNLGSASSVSEVKDRLETFADEKLAETLAGYVSEDIGNEAPVADFSFAPVSPEVGESVSFTDLSSDGDGSVVSWSWSFGDGGSSSVQNPSHSFSGSGSYSVVLTVMDNDGAAGIVSKDVNVFSESTLTVQLLYPTGGEILNGTTTVSWSAEDPSCENLIVHLQYSINEGLAWRYLKKDLPNTGEFLWDTNTVSDGAYMLMVIAINDADEYALDSSNSFTTVSYTHLTLPTN